MTHALICVMALISDLCDPLALVICASVRINVDFSSVGQCCSRWWFLFFRVQDKSKWRIVQAISIILLFRLLYSVEWVMVFQSRYQADLGLQLSKKYHLNGHHWFYSQISKHYLFVTMTWVFLTFNDRAKRSDALPTAFNSCWGMYSVVARRATSSAWLGCMLKNLIFTTYLNPIFPFLQWMSHN